MRTNTPKKILVVCPSFPFPESGAEQKERAEGLRQLVRLGYEVTVIAKTTEWADSSAIQTFAKDIGIKILLVPYRFSNKKLSRIERLKKMLGKLRNPLFIDGAAYEYSEPVIKEAMRKTLQEFRPDVVWFEYSYLWPLYPLVRKAGIPIITRSQNFEAEHFLEEDGRTLLNYIKFIPKYFGERRSLRESTFVFTISPHEEKTYKTMTDVPVATLPDRNVSRLVELPRPEIRDRAPLHIFFMGASYNVPHNKAALEFILTQILPELEQQAPGDFIFHATGSKLPDTLRKYFNGTSIIFEGFVDDLNAFCMSMDIALMPSLMGAGQQFKILESIIRGIPTVASPRGIAGWALYPGQHFLSAEKPKEFASSLISLKDTSTRERLSYAASEQTKKLFGREELDTLVQGAISSVLQKK